MWDQDLAVDPSRSPVLIPGGRGLQMRFLGCLQIEIALQTVAFEMGAQRGHRGSIEELLHILLKLFLFRAPDVQLRGPRRAGRRAGTRGRPVGGPLELVLRVGSREELPAPATFSSPFPDSPATALKGSYRFDGGRGVKVGLLLANVRTPRSATTIAAEGDAQHPVVTTLAV